MTISMQQIDIYPLTCSHQNAQKDSKHGESPKMRQKQKKG